jgi:hypothetical protein
VTRWVPQRKGNYLAMEDIKYVILRKKCRWRGRNIRMIPFTLSIASSVFDEANRQLRRGLEK